MPGMNLTREEAAARGLVAVASYDVELDLTVGASETFARPEHGALPLPPSRAPRPSSTWSAATAELGLNGTALDPAEVFAGTRIRLDGPGRRQRAAWSGDLPRTCTPARGCTASSTRSTRVYLYTQFEVADARRMFTVFEQPDLKATVPVHRDRARRLAGGLQLADPRRPSRPA